MTLSQPIDTAVQMLRAQYLETPNLRLTPGEAAERVQLDRPTAVAALQALEESGFLVLTIDGNFSLAADSGVETSTS